MTKVSLMIGEAEALRKYASNLYAIIEQKFIESTEELTIKQVCLIGLGFGNQHGSQKIFDKIEETIAQKNKEIDGNHLKMIFQGLIFNRRISKNLLLALKPKYFLLTQIDGLHE